MAKEEATVSNLKEDVTYSPYGQQKVAPLKHWSRLQRQEELGSISYLSGDLDPRTFEDFIGQDETVCCCGSHKVENDAWRSLSKKDQP